MRMFAATLPILVIGLGLVYAQPQTGKLLSPADVVKLAADDIVKLPANVQQYIRYLSLASAKETDRATFAAVLSGHVNSLSTESDIIPLVAADKDKILLRVNLQDYGIKTDIWEQLADVDPYFHTNLVEQVTKLTNKTIKQKVIRKQSGTKKVKQKVKREWKRENEIEYVKVYGEWQRGYHWNGSKWVQSYDDYEDVEVEVPTGEVEVEDEIEVPIASQEPTGKTIRATAPWLPADKMKILLESTQSKAPVMDGQWFLNQTAINVDRKIGYYKWLGIKDQKSFEDLAGFDRKLLDKAKRVQLVEAVALSGVSIQPRRIVAFNTVSPIRYWLTFDNKQALDKHNPLRTLDEENFEFDASEAIAGLPNEMLFYGLWNNKGVLQDSAPDLVGFNHSTVRNDGRIHAMSSCVQCHYATSLGGDAGLQKIDGWARNLLVGQLAFQSHDPDVVKKFRQQYLRDLQGPLIDNRTVHARALLQATGMTPPQWGKEFSRMWSTYEDADVDVNLAAQLLGTTTEDLQASLKAPVQTSGYIDPVLSVFLLPKDKKRAIPIHQFEEIVEQAEQALYQYKQTVKTIKH